MISAPPTMRCSTPSPSRMSPAHHTSPRRPSDIIGVPGSRAHQSCITENDEHCEERHVPDLRGGRRLRLRNEHACARRRLRPGRLDIGQSDRGGVDRDGARVDLLDCDGSSATVTPGRYRALPAALEPEVGRAPPTAAGSRVRHRAISIQSSARCGRAGGEQGRDGGGGRLAPQVVEHDVPSAAACASRCSRDRGIVVERDDLVRADAGELGKRAAGLRPAPTTRPAPSRLATWTAIAPALPVAPRTRTDWPGWS